MKTKFKKDWWFYNGLLWILTGIYFLVPKIIEGNVSLGLISGGINILAGIALLQKSKIIFWITFLVATITLIKQFVTLINFPNIRESLLNPIQLITTLILFIFSIMLLQQIKKEAALKLNKK